MLVSNDFAPRLNEDNTEYEFHITCNIIVIETTDIIDKAKCESF